MANEVPCTRPGGYLAAKTVLQGDDEHPLTYYDRIFQAYFGNKREPGMEEDECFKFVFSNNLNSEINRSVNMRISYRNGTMEELKERAVTVFEAYRKYKTPLEVYPDEMVSSHLLELEGGRASAPPPKEGKKKQVFQSNKPQQDGALRNGRNPEWFNFSPERMCPFQMWNARPENRKDGYQRSPFSKEGPPSQRPVPLAPRAGQSEASRKPQEFQENGPKPLNSDETETLHSLLEPLKHTNADEQPGALCGNIIADNSESMNNNVPTVTDSQHDIVVTNSDSPSSDERGVHSNTNDGEPSRDEHSDEAVTALTVRMDQNYTERGKRKKKRWPKPIRVLCKVLFQLHNQLILNKGSLTSAHGTTSSPLFVVPHDHRGVRLVHAHDLPSTGHKGEHHAKSIKNTFAFAQKNLEKSAEGRNVYYDQKASHKELQVGDKVWHYVFAPTTGKEGSGPGTLTRKLMPRWTGPHLITDKLSSVVYQIKISKGQKEPVVKWVHRNQVKPYKASNDSTGDKDLTNSDLVGKRVAQAEAK